MKKRTNIKKRKDMKQLCQCYCRICYTEWKYEIKSVKQWALPQCPNCSTYDVQSRLTPLTPVRRKTKKKKE